MSRPAKTDNFTRNVYGWNVPVGMSWDEFCEFRMAMGFSKPRPLKTLMEMKQEIYEEEVSRKRNTASNKKMDRDKLIDIFKKRLEGYSYKSLAHLYKVSEVAISYICSGRRWADIYTNDAEYMELLNQVKQYGAKFRRSVRKQWQREEEARVSGIFATMNKREY